MASKWFRGDVVAIIYLLSGTMGVFLTLGNMLMRSSFSLIFFIVSLALFVLFLTVTVGGAWTLQDIRSRSSLSYPIAHYHRLNVLITPFVMMISLPRLLGWGLEQMIVIGFMGLLFIFPSCILMKMYHVPLIPAHKKQSWQEWVKSGYLHFKKK